MITAALVLHSPAGHKVGPLRGGALPPVTMKRTQLVLNVLSASQLLLWDLHRPRCLWSAASVQLLVRVVILDVVVQKTRLPERLGAAGRWTLEGVVVQLNGEDWWGLVLYDPVH